MMPNPLWTHRKVRAAQTSLELFSTWISSRAGKPLQSYGELHHCSVTDSPAFWSALRDFTKVSGDKGREPVLRGAARIPGAAPAIAELTR